MALVRPFTALVYDRARVELGRVLAPPYDVIDAAGRTELAARDPHNVVRLILPEDGGGSGGSPERYARAAALLDDWVREKVLVCEREPSVWVHAHEFDAPRGGGGGGGGRRTRAGVWAAVRLVELDGGEVLPHERTLAGPKADRLALMRAVKTQLSPIFFIAEDPSGGIADAVASLAAEKPDAVAELPAGERHALRRLTGARAAGLAGLVGSGRLLIADGHHRYETALAYRDEVRESGARLPGADFVLAYIVSERDEGLLLLPTHRTVAWLPALEPGAALERARASFDVTPLEAADADAVLRALEDAGTTTRRVVADAPVTTAAAFVAWFRGAARPVLLRLRPEAAARMPGTLRDVPVAALHDVFLPLALGLDAERQRTGGNLEFTRDAGYALRQLRAGEAQAAFFVLPPTLAELRAAAAAGERFPPKTTYFAPKVPTGIALRSLDA